MFLRQQVLRQARQLKKSTLRLRRGLSFLLLYRLIRQSGIFDAEFYLQVNEDVQRSGLQPIWHYLLYGVNEGRSPNALFDADWYRRAYPDIGRSGIDPVKHFLREGAEEGRDPGPQFDLKCYLQENPDIQTKSRNALGHYIQSGRAEGRSIQPSRLCRGMDASLLLPIDVDRKGQVLVPRPSRQLIDVIIPVYRNLEATRCCIDSVLSSKNKVRYRLIVIDDGSPEEGLVEYVALIKHASVPLLVLRNVKNLGFVKTVNLGMSKSQSRDVVLLNSDTEVADGWLDRLIAHAYSDDWIATVTPFSNNATIFSYPQIGGQSKLPRGLSLSDVNSAFAEANNGRSVDIPVGVGFCMFIRRAALQEVGLFDATAFGRGYGEECDFCLRATRSGWRHLLACDTFVAHIGEVSFQGDSAAGQENAKVVLNTRYPTYRAQIARFVEADPMAEARMAATLNLLRRAERPRVLQICHQLGGGTEKHMQDVGAELGSTVYVLFLRAGPSHDPGLVVDLDVPCGGERQRGLVRFRDAAQVIEFFTSLRLERLHFQHILGFSPVVLRALRSIGVPFEFTAHDYFIICPRIQLMKPGGVYCGEPDAAGCTRCLANDVHVQAKDISVWRETHAWLVRDAERVQCPSKDASRRLLRYFPGQILHVVPHDEQKKLIAHAQTCVMPALSDTLRVITLGHLSVHKGKEFLLAIARLAVAQDLSIKFTCLGSWEHPPLCLPESLRVMGPYKDDNLSHLIEMEDPHVIFFPARWPETYSYTLTSALQSRRMILAPRLGAFTERLVQVPSARLFSPQASPGEVLELLLDAPVSWHEQLSAVYAQ